MAILAVASEQNLPAWAADLQKSAQTEFASMVEALHTYVKIELETKCCEHVPEIEERSGIWIFTPERKSRIAHTVIKLETEQTNPVLSDEGFNETVIQPFLLFSQKAEMCFMQLKMTLASNTESRSWTCAINKCTRVHTVKFPAAQKNIFFQ